MFARAVCASGPKAWFPAVSSIGYRPTVGGTELLLEVHFFDLDQELYGTRLDVEFVAKLREETHFESLDEMVLQMRRDDAAARNVLAASYQQ